MKHLWSKQGLILLAMNILIGYALYDGYQTGLTGGRAGPDYSRADSPLGYWFFMAIYLVGALCSLVVYGWFILHPSAFEPAATSDECGEEHNGPGEVTESEPAAYHAAKTSDAETSAAKRDCPPAG